MILRARCSHQHPTRRALLCDLPADHHGDYARTRHDSRTPQRTCWTDDGATWKDRC